MQKMIQSDTVRTRTRTLVRKLTSSPTLPLLGWTKAVETVVAAGPTLRWIAYAALVTAIWIAADWVAEAADDAVDDLEAIDG